MYTISALCLVENKTSINMDSIAKHIDISGILVFAAVEVGFLGLIYYF
jgi:predicted DNA-binding transcriptional regulator